VVDLGSTNGTFVNGSRIEARTRLERGDVLRIGQTELGLE
jgi:pSer/pThr/pTyr-binding forkhead associated (FHA) protein